MLRSASSSLGLASVLLLIVGCGSDASVEAVPVSGVVKINGQPTEGVAVSFLPLRSESNKSVVATDATGTSDASGNFELAIPITGQEGAMVGKYRVTFTAGNYKTTSEDGAPGPYEPIPPKYNLESKEEFTVPEGGTDQANFDLDIPNFKRTP